MEAIYASDLHSGLEQLWQKALNYRGPVIILADAKEQIRIENELIKRFASGAFMHIQVMSLSRLALETFARHRDSLRQDRCDGFFSGRAHSML